MKLVAASEHDLLLIAEALVGGADPLSVAPLLARARRLPPGLGPTSLDLLQDTLGKGLVRWCAKNGAMPERHIGDARPMRAWERHKVLGLELSPASVHILRWLTSQRMDQPTNQGLDLRTATAGDELVLVLAVDLLRKVQLTQSIALQPMVRRSSWCWLAFPDTLALHKGPPDDDAWRMRLEPTVIVECLQPVWARRWAECEEAKAGIADAALLERIGLAQGAVLQRWFDACDAAGRRDLTRFALIAGAKLLADPRDARRFVSGLDASQPISRRAAAAHASVALLQSLDRWAGWTREHRNVRFFEDGYERAQLLLQDWERIGDEGHARARAHVQQLSSLDAVAVR